MLLINLPLLFDMRYRNASKITPTCYRVTYNGEIVPKNSAQRQANYRKYHLKEEYRNDKRLDLVITSNAKSALDRLASCYCLTKKQLIEQLLFDKETEALNHVALISPDGSGKITAKNHRITTACSPGKLPF